MNNDFFGKEIQVGSIVAYGYRDHNHGYVDIVLVTDIKDGWIEGWAKPESQWKNYHNPQALDGARLRKFSLIDHCIVLPMTKEQWEELGK